MKNTLKSIAVLTGACLAFVLPSHAQQWTTSGTNIYNNNAGNVGIGTGASAPIQKLDVNGRIHVNNGVIQRGGSAITTTSDLGLYSLVYGNYIRFVTNGAPFKFYSDGGTTPMGGTPLVSLEPSGKVVIGPVNTPGNYRLYVKDGILAEKVKVAVATSADWSDYVFGENYKLRSIAELESFVKTNRHLPNVPSAEEVVKEGIDVATMDAKLLEKIEELSLYIIELKKETTELRKENTDLLQRVEKMEQH